ncbi:MAG: PriCT-2 domain-containing protein, partial [Burkholderiaceae bacterium]|nr:PriCT-2 domain-containing protein [Burkholderiaceae bacterium]
MTAITSGRIRAALAHLSPALPRDEWARVAMAIKSEFPDSTGLDLFDEWSLRDADGYDAKAVKSTWKSVKAGGGVTIGTLLQQAQQHGFELPKPDATQAPAAAPDAAELARQRCRPRTEREQAEKQATQQAQAEAADRARALWDAATPAPADHPYLNRKGVQAHGLRVGADGWLLVPLLDAAGTLWNVQRIAPAKLVDGGPEKLFLKGGRVAGLWHLLGDPAAADAVLVAEGYATAASLHEATGRPVAVAFNAHGLKPVATALHKQAPGALVVLCGDDDADTQKRTGKNPGREAAEAAARLVHGLAVLPVGLPAGGSDFNDLHQHAGLDAVRSQIEAAIEAHRDTRPSAKASDVKPAPDPNDRFELSARGVLYIGRDKEGNLLLPQWLCATLAVTART